MGQPVDGRRAANGTPVAERLALHSRLNPETGCIEWTGAIHDAAGYARIGIKRRMTYVHIAAWQLINGPVPDGLKLRHKCDNPPCFNAEHLEPGTQRQNVGDMIARRRANRVGERNNASKLNASQVADLRCRRGGGESVAALSAAFQISKSQVRNIVDRRAWASVA